MNALDRTIQIYLFSILTHFIFTQLFATCHHSAHVIEVCTYAHIYAKGLFI